MPIRAVELFVEDLLRRRRMKDADESLSIFQNLSEDSIQALLSNSQIQNVPAQQDIVRQGDNPEHLYLILEGSIKTLRYGADGGEATIRMLKSGETFMDAVIFMGGKSPVHAIAIEDSRLLLIPAATVRHHAIHDAQFACNLLKIVTRHYKNAMQQIDSIITKTPAERLGYYLLKLHLEQGSDSMDVSIPFQKSTIANHLGMTPETFSRALGQMKKMGMDVDQDKLTMHDAFVLCHFCDPDTAHSCPRFETDQCPLTSDSCTEKGCH